MSQYRLILDKSTKVGNGSTVSKKQQTPAVITKIEYRTCFVPAPTVVKGVVEERGAVVSAWWERKYSYKLGDTPNTTCRLCLSLWSRFPALFNGRKIKTIAYKFLYKIISLEIQILCQIFFIPPPPTIPQVSECEFFTEPPPPPI